jgi:hypothetical protein
MRAFLRQGRTLRGGNARWKAGDEVEAFGVPRGRARRVSNVRE